MKSCYAIIRPSSARASTTRITTQIPSHPKHCTCSPESLAPHSLCSVPRHGATIINSHTCHKPHLIPFIKPKLTTTRLPQWSPRLRRPPLRTPSRLALLQSPALPRTRKRHRPHARPLFPRATILYAKALRRRRRNSPRLLPQQQFLPGPATRAIRLRQYVIG